MAVIKDVAKLACVSVGTVSKYLNTPGKLKNETRQRVEEAIAALQYKPSPLARSMRTGRTHTIAVITPDITNPFFAEVYHFIRLFSFQKGYTSILYTTQDNLESLMDYLSNMSIRNIDGIILCFPDEDDAAEKLITEVQSHVPVVLLNWDIQNTKLSTVVVDVFEGVYKSTRHLISQGHKDIAFIGGPAGSKISGEKFNGYCKAMAEAGHTVHPERVFHGNYTLQSGYHAARSITALSPVPTAVVAANDIMAIGSIKYFHQKKILVPDDISVIGFDNIPLSSMYEPALSTISLPIEQMAGEAVKILLSKLEKPQSKNRQVILETELVVRTSTDKNAPRELYCD